MNGTSKILIFGNTFTIFCTSFKTSLRLRQTEHYVFCLPASGPLSLALCVRFAQACSLRFARAAFAVLGSFSCGGTRRICVDTLVACSALAPLLSPCSSVVGPSSLLRSVGLRGVSPLKPRLWMVGLPPLLYSRPATCLGCSLVDRARSLCTESGWDGPGPRH